MKATDMVFLQDQAFFSQTAAWDPVKQSKACFGLDALILIHFFGGLLYVLALMLFDPLFLHPRTKTSCLQLGRGDLNQWKTRTPSSNTRDNLRPPVIALWEKVVRTTPKTNMLDI